MNVFAKLLSRGEVAACTHVPEQLAEPHAAACGECGSTFNLRVCTSCGYVGCCESQKGHNSKHARQSGHQVIKSLPVTQGHFTWCYACNRYL